MNSFQNPFSIMVAGAHGFMGSRIIDRWPSAIPVPSLLLRRADSRLADFVREHHPDLLINAAAISDISTCERHPDDSYSANVALPAMLAAAARETGSKLISFSSDQVYTGCPDSGPYREEDVPPSPAGIYARHKLEAEQRVLDILPDAVLLRVTWLYDMPLYRDGSTGHPAPSPHANRGNFLIGILDSLLRGTDIRYSSRQYRGITYVRQAVALLEQARLLPGGVYNYGSENSLNMLETAKALLHELNLNGCVKDTEEDRHNLWMDCRKLRARGLVFDDTVQGFRRCINDYGLRKEDIL